MTQTLNSRQAAGVCVPEQCLEFAEHTMRAGLVARTDVSISGISVEALKSLERIILNHWWKVSKQQQETICCEDHPCRSVGQNSFVQNDHSISSLLKFIPKRVTSICKQGYSTSVRVPICLEQFIPLQHVVPGQLSLGLK